jgi:tetratricopeptide (TPR) repeat protein
MRNVPPDKYTVAWFKLAECVSRGEKERALGVYRLLAHSIHDPAFVRQLQGDILCSFNDYAGAVEHYRAAAQLYQDSERFLEAAAVYEHVVVLTSDKKPYLAHLIVLYSKLGMTHKLLAHAQALCALLLGAQEYDQALEVLGHLDEQVPEADMLTLRQQVVSALAAAGYVLTPQVQEHIGHIITGLVTLGQGHDVQRFMMTLEEGSQDYYEAAQVYAADK